LDVWEGQSLKPVLTSSVSNRNTAFNLPGATPPE
jgi:hypothetical protein